MRITIGSRHRALRPPRGRDIVPPRWLRTGELLVALALGHGMVWCAADAQPPANVHRIGYLRRTTPQPQDLDAFRHGLRALGYIEGSNIVIEQRHADEVAERLPTLAAELVELKVEVLVVDGNLTTTAARAATTTIPIVFTLVSAPVESGLVASVARPGGNLTGLTFIHPELSGKRLELLTQAVPYASRIAGLLNPDNPTVLAVVPELQRSAQALGVELHLFAVREARELDSAFAAMAQWRAEALLLLNDAVFFSQRVRMVELAAQGQLPALYDSREFVAAGGLMSYGTRFPDLWRRAATYVDKLLKGAKLADLPVEQPMQFELVINLKTAQALGITIPPTLLFLADEVIR
jgi:putative ABC transport system substrate-binding protein